MDSASHRITCARSPCVGRENMPSSYGEKVRGLQDVLHESGWRVALARLAHGIWWRLKGVRFRITREVSGLMVDRRYGISTRRVDWSVGDERAGRVGYVATRPSEFKATLRSLRIEPAKFTFVDLGCGRGATLFMAIEAGFRSVVGVEIFAALVASAQSNIVSYSRRDREGATRIEVVHANAIDYELPPGPVVVFLYHPFGSETLRAVVRRIDESFCNDPRPIFVMYVNPVHASVMTDDTVLRPIVHTTKWSTFRAVT